MASIAAHLPIDRGLIDRGMIDHSIIDRIRVNLISEARRQIFEK